MNDLFTLFTARLDAAGVEYMFYREGGSERHVHDIRGMLRHSSDAIDHVELRRLLDERGLTDVWAEVDDGPAGRIG